MKVKMSKDEDMNDNTTRTASKRLKPVIEVQQRFKAYKMRSYRVVLCHKKIVRTSRSVLSYFEKKITLTEYFPEKHPALPIHSKMLSSAL